MALAVLILPSLNPPVASTNAVKPPGSIAIAIAWPDGPADVDLWVSGPGEPIAVGYSNKAGKLFSLLRDDTGVDGDMSPLNMENAFARATPAGEYVVNIHGYSLPFGTTKVYVEVSLGRSADSMKLLVSTELELRYQQERTVIRFKLDERGQVVPGSVNNVFKALRSSRK
jgi:hypothetical protein